MPGRSNGASRRQSQDSETQVPRSDTPDLPDRPRRFMLTLDGCWGLLASSAEKSPGLTPWK